MSIIYMKVRLHKQEVASRRWENPEFQRIINGYQWQYTGYTWDAGYRCWVHLIVGQTDILGFGVEHSPGSQLSGLLCPLMQHVWLEKESTFKLHQVPAPLRSTRVNCRDKDRHFGPWKLPHPVSAFSKQSPLAGKPSVSIPAGQVIGIQGPQGWILKGTQVICISDNANILMLIDSNRLII